MNNNFCPAKRENNPRRDFIFVNKFQSKHYPSDPRETASHCAFLGREMAKRCPDGECLAIVFSETAVGIGALAASELGSRCFLLSTTREELPEHFSTITIEESHSHAPLHKLCVREEIDFGKYSHVFVIDDEFTTGRTAISLCNALSGMCNCSFTAVAFAASEVSRRNFSDNKIDLIAEETFNEDDFVQVTQKFNRDTLVTPKEFDLDVSVNSLFDIRLGSNCGELFEECKRLCNTVLTQLDSALNGVGSVEVIGTEELCLPPVLLGLLLSEKGITVRVHGVTRSPMLPSDEEGYPIRERIELTSLYDSGRKVYLYNRFASDLTIVMTDAYRPDNDALSRLCGACGGKRAALVRWRGRGMQTSLNSADCRLLLKDITGRIDPLPPSEREPLIRKGVHYCELLPTEHEPSEAYISQYDAGLRAWGRQTAEAVRAVAEKMLAEKGKGVVIVSLARAGTPVGVLVKRYLKRFHGIDAAHYSVSIIRGRGLDRNAMRYILARHDAKKIQFLDGWTGKGAIARQLAEALTDYPEVDSRPAVLADPAGLCEIYGTRRDIFIPCSCLNSVVSGLFSRTVLRSDLVGCDDFHGSAYFGELEKFDRTYEFIDAIEREMALLPPFKAFECQAADGAGLEETRQIAQEFGVSDINLVKPSIGEATRVLLRRVPRVILIKSQGSALTSHLEQLAAEKGVPIQEYPLRCYEAVGIIDN
ncbi:MAG: phosphoribosyltransferase [Oscillospiraceae bacterium]|nr:phosphoribosyltransferase [Oscillospiraceae bacterium]